MATKPTLAERWRTFWYWHSFGVIIIGAIVVILTLAAAGLVMAERKRLADEAAFMAECLEHEPNYKCTAMWRAGGRQVVPMPMPIIIPTGR